MAANDRQIGGKHYNKDGEQHWDRMWRLYGRGYFVGCITKYAERYHLKNGIQDLEKSVHFLQKLIELETKELEKKQLQEIVNASMAKAGTVTEIPTNHQNPYANITDTN